MTTLESLKGMTDCEVEFSIEAQMRIPVAKWLLSRNLIPVCEVGSLRNCDLVGVRFSEKPVVLTELIAVELKLRKVAAVLSQCERHMNMQVTEVWAAMLPAVAHRHAGRFKDIGLLAVTATSVEIVQPATRFEGRDLGRWKNAMRRRRNEYIWRMKHPLMYRFGSLAASAEVA